MPDTTTEYINTTDYDKLATKLRHLVNAMDENYRRNLVAREMRYFEVDIEAERKSGRIQPDELIIPQHIIDTNIRREQSSYVQYITQSPRAVILSNVDDPTTDTTVLEKDITEKLRYDGWQLAMFAAIDSMQQNGYGILEIVQDDTTPGELATEHVQYGDFGYIGDTKNIQESELLVRNYYFPRTRLLEMCDDQNFGFDRTQVDILIKQEPQGLDDTKITTQDKSLFKVQKVLFRIKGIVHVAWAAYNICQKWLRGPKPLYLGRRELVQNMTVEQVLESAQTGIPQSRASYETLYPYVLFPYLISENDVISQLKGRVFLDQDCQQAVISLVSSYVTAHRRASGLYFSKESNDPNDDTWSQKRDFFRVGTIVPGNIKQFQLQSPGSDVISSINMLITANQQETSQVNFAAQNRKDSRKTAEEIRASNSASQALSTVQVVLFSTSIRELYSRMFDIIKSRVNAGLLKVNQLVQPFFNRRYNVKPSGDTDVIERMQVISAMMNAWPVMKETAAAVPFLCDLLGKMFPEYSAKYIQIIQQADAQQKSVQVQQQQMIAKNAAQGITNLARHPEMFSDVGKIHALPAVQAGAQQIEQMSGGGDGQ